MLRRVVSETKIKAGHLVQRSHSRSSVSRRTAAVLAGTAILLVGGLSAAHLALSQQPSATKFDVEGRRRDLLAHLNAVIQFYRATTVPIQKIGEPNDIAYRDQAVTLATRAAQFSFQSAQAEAALMTEYQRHEGIAVEQSGPVEQQKLQAMETNTVQQINDLKSRETALDRQVASASPKDRPALEAQRKQLEASLDLGNAMKDALDKVVGMSDAQGAPGLAGEVDSLKRSLPQLGSKTPPVAASLESLDQAQSSGVSSQTIALFGLLGAEHSLDSLLRDNDDLHKQTLALRAPISDLLHSLLEQGKQLSQQSISSSTTPGKEVVSTSTAQNLETITATFKAVSSASVPRSQEIIVLEQSQANLTAWRGAVDREYKRILQALLLRLLVIAIALGVIFAAGELWTRATNKYVREARRRRQLLLLRRAVVGFLSAIVLLFGFVTQFNSLATFAGFITAGIAVGLQTILLSVAAYFFIIGRYGIKVGDRITIPPVTGEVIEVGLVRFYMMELAGKGTELNPTGRVAVFSNAVLFQAGAPIYKQIPGTEYAWHELIVKLSETANYKQASEAILKVVHSIYDGYRHAIELQHRSVEQWMHTSITSPEVESRIQFDGGGSLQLWARFPVQIKRASETDEEMTEALLQLLAESPEVKAAVAAIPLLQPSVKG
jgi:small-conductance mechanosensitive channel